MRVFGSKNCTDAGIHRSRSGFGVCLLVFSALVLAACASGGDGEAISPYQESQANRDMASSARELSQPLVQDTVSEAKTIGSFIGGIVSAATGKDSSVGVGVNYGALGGSLAGRYVAAKQEEYSEEVEVIEAITRDLEGKNQDAERTIKAMEVVVAEDRARLEEIRKAKAEGKLSKKQMQQEIAFAERDLETMRKARDAAEGHLETFVEARSIVLEDSDNENLEQVPQMDALDGEIEVLRARIKAMSELVDDLSRVS